MFLHPNDGSPSEEDVEAFPHLPNSDTAEEGDDEEDAVADDGYEQQLEQEYDPSSLWEGPLTSPQFDFDVEDNTTMMHEPPPGFRPSYAWVARGPDS